MIELNVCPSTLQEGFGTYSPAARKLLFDGMEVSHILNFDSPNNESSDNNNYLKNVGRISLSGVQPKASLVVNANSQLAKSLVDHSFLSGTLKRSYWLSFNYRRATLAAE